MKKFFKLLLSASCCLTVTISQNIFGFLRQPVGYGYNLMPELKTYYRTYKLTNYKTMVDYYDVCLVPRDIYSDPRQPDEEIFINSSMFAVYGDRICVFNPDEGAYNCPIVHHDSFFTKKHSISIINEKSNKKLTINLKGKRNIITIQDLHKSKSYNHKHNEQTLGELVVEDNTFRIINNFGSTLSSGSVSAGEDRVQVYITSVFLSFVRNFLSDYISVYEDARKNVCSQIKDAKFELGSKNIKVKKRHAKSILINNQ